MRSREPLYFSTTASIIAFCEAETDRMDWLDGVAPDMHITEPSPDDEITQRFLRLGAAFTL